MTVAETVRDMSQTTPMTWVFDVDATLVDAITGSSLRPGAQDLLASLRAEGCRTVLWSAGGAAYARRRATQHGIAHLFDAFEAKDERDGAGKLCVAGVVDEPAAAVFVDDQPEDLPDHVEVVAVPPYLSHQPSDRGLASLQRGPTGRIEVTLNQ
jgi:hypothetical protein